MHGRYLHPAAHKSMSAGVPGVLWDDGTPEFKRMLKEHDDHVRDYPHLHAERLAEIEKHRKEMEGKPHPGQHLIDRMHEEWAADPTREYHVREQGK